MPALRGLKPKATLILEKDGVEIIDEKTAGLLLLIQRTGSILTASKILGLAYSRAWEAIAKIERSLKLKIVEAKRGGRSGGGAKLTKHGEKILQFYLSEYHRLLHRSLVIRRGGVEAPELIYAGSNDLLLEHIFGTMRRKGIELIEAAWIGSSGGLSSLMLREADLAGLHLYDPSTGEYNTPFLQRYWLEDQVVLVRGYYRELGFASRIDLDDPLSSLINGELKIINRNLGSGTRIFLDHLIKEAAERLGLSFREAVKGIRGYGEEVNTHMEVVRAIAMGKADVGLTLRWAAEKHGLRFKPLKWERFDFAIPVDKLAKKPVKKFLEILKSEELKNLANKLTGYRIPEEAGEIVYKPSG